MESMLAVLSIRPDSRLNNRKSLLIFNELGLLDLKCAGRGMTAVKLWSIGGSGSIGIFAAAHGNGGSDSTPRRRRTGGGPAPRRCLRWCWGRAAPGRRDVHARLRRTTRSSLRWRRQRGRRHTSAVATAGPAGRRRPSPAGSSTAWRSAGTAPSCTSRRLAWQSDAELRPEGADCSVPRRLRGARNPSAPTCSAARRQGFRRTAAWGSPSRRARRPMLRSRPVSAR